MKRSSCMLSIVTMAMTVHSSLPSLPCICVSLLQITVDRVMELLPRYATLAEEPTCGSFVVPSTFHGVVDKLCRVPLKDGAKETELVKSLVRNVREHYTAAFYSPVLEIIEVSEPEALRWAMIRTSFLINYASLENVFTLELVAAMLCQACQSTLFLSPLLLCSSFSVLSCGYTCVYACISRNHPLGNGAFCSSSSTDLNEKRPCLIPYEESPLPFCHCHENA
jgi:hypothetical protein